MSFEIVCDCGQKLRANEMQAGKKFPCPKCNQLVSVPFAGSSDQQVSIPKAVTNKYSSIAVVFSLIAIVISTAAILLIVMSNPLGAGMSKYDFSTPKDALNSYLDIEIKQDIQAQIDLSRLIGGEKAREKKDTLKINRDAEYEGKKILFVSYKKDGVTQYEVVAFEKDADSGLWYTSYISTYGIDDPGLKKTVQEWEKRTDAD